MSSMGRRIGTTLFLYADAQFIGCPSLPRAPFMLLSQTKVIAGELLPMLLSFTTVVLLGAHVWCPSSAVFAASGPTLGIPTLCPAVISGWVTSTPSYAASLYSVTVGEQ